MTPPNTKDSSKGSAQGQKAQGQNQGASEQGGDPAKNRREGLSANQVDKRLNDIEKYLTRLTTFLNRYDWNATPIKFKPGNGPERGGSNPPGWPP